MFGKKGDLGRPYKDGEVIARQNEMSGTLYVVQGGKVQVVLESDYGKEVIELLRPGRMFGAVSVITKDPYPASYVAKGEARVISIDHELFMQRLHEDPSFCYHLMEELAGDILSLHRELDNQAVRDSLTRTFIRRKFDELIRKELSRSARQNTDVSIALFEIDNCMKINAQYGNEIGNQLIRDVAMLLQETIRTPDILIRWSGSQFLAILPDTDFDQAMNAGERYRLAVESTSFIDEVTSTISVGIAHHEDNDNPDNMVQRANLAIGRARGKGRNQVQGSRTIEANGDMENLQWVSV